MVAPMKRIKQILTKFFNCFGFRVERINKSFANQTSEISPFSTIINRDTKIVDLESLRKIGASIPGMIGTYSGSHLYSLCYFQKEKGDVVEIGSWQGRSTVFLGWATKNSGNGELFAIDHFQGNIGKEKYYVVETEDLSDLKNGFEENMRNAGLSDSVTLIPHKSSFAKKTLSNRMIRFLFIDGDHSAEGVSTDIELFFPLLVKGGLVVFDDFSHSQLGIVAAAEKILAKNAHSRVMSYANTLVIKIR
jgi:hypothetical protein